MDWSRRRNQVLVGTGVVFLFVVLVLVCNQKAQRRYENPYLVAWKFAYSCAEGSRPLLFSALEAREQVNAMVLFPNAKTRGYAPDPRDVFVYEMARLQDTIVTTVGFTNSIGVGKGLWTLELKSDQSLSYWEAFEQWLALIGVIEMPLLPDRWKVTKILADDGYYMRLQQMAEKYKSMAQEELDNVLLEALSLQDPAIKAMVEKDDDALNTIQEAQWVVTAAWMDIWVSKQLGTQWVQAKNTQDIEVAIMQGQWPLSP